jgi:hypothetical protein
MGAVSLIGQKTFPCHEQSEDERLRPALSVDHKKGRHDGGPVPSLRYDVISLRKLS